MRVNLQFDQIWIELGPPDFVFWPFSRTGFASLSRQSTGYALTARVTENPCTDGYRVLRAKSWQYTSREGWPGLQLD